MPPRPQRRTAYRVGWPVRISAPATRLCPEEIHNGSFSCHGHQGRGSDSEEPAMGFYIKDLYVHRVPKFDWHDKLTNPPTVPETSPIIQVAALSPHLEVEGRGGGLVGLPADD